MVSQKLPFHMPPSPCHCQPLSSAGLQVHEQVQCIVHALHQPLEGEVHLAKLLGFCPGAGYPFLPCQAIGLAPPARCLVPGFNLPVFSPAPTFINSLGQELHTMAHVIVWLAGGQAPRRISTLLFTHTSLSFICRARHNYLEPRNTRPNKCKNRHMYSCIQGSVLLTLYLLSALAHGISKPGLVLGTDVAQVAGLHSKHSNVPC